MCSSSACTGSVHHLEGISGAAGGQGGGSRRDAGGDAALASASLAALRLGDVASKAGGADGGGAGDSAAASVGRSPGGCGREGHAAMEMLAASRHVYRADDKDDFTGLA